MNELTVFFTRNGESKTDTYSGNNHTWTVDNTTLHINKWSEAQEGWFSIKVYNNWDDLEIVWREDYA